MSKRQHYNNRGMRRLLTSIIAWTLALGGNFFNRKYKIDFLDTSFHSGGGSGGNTKLDQSTSQFKHKATIEKKRKRKEVDKSKRINRKRNARVCSFK